jgi:hypothetical protein
MSEGERKKLQLIEDAGIAKLYLRLKNASLWPETGVKSLQMIAGKFGYVQFVSLFL